MFFTLEGDAMTQWIRSITNSCLSKIRQLPTLPQLKLKYHWRRKVSRPSSEWDRVGPFRNSHRIIDKHVTAFSWCLAINFLIGIKNRYPIPDHICKISDTHSRSTIRRLSKLNKVIRIISISQLNASQRFHPWPINVVVYHNPNGDTLFRGRLPA